MSRIIGNFGNLNLDLIRDDIRPYLQALQPHLENEKWTYTGYTIFTYLEQNPHPHTLCLLPPRHTHIMALLHHEHSQPLVMSWLSRWTTPLLLSDSSSTNMVDQLSHNASDWALDWLEQCPKYINWDNLSANPHAKAVRMLTANPDKINWSFIQENPNPEAFALFWKQHELVGVNICSRICTNPNALTYLESKKLELMTTHKWNHMLCLHPDDRVVDWYKDYPHCIDWVSMCQNPCDAAVRLILSQSMDQLRTYAHALIRNPRREILQLVIDHWNEWEWETDWSMATDTQCLLVANPAIFQGYDHQLQRLFGSKAWDYRPFLKERMITSGLAQELMANRFHPHNMHLWQGWGHEDEQDFS